MQPLSPDSERARIADLLREAADRHGVERRVVLAFAWIESRWNPSAEGDLIWHERSGGALYRRHVLNNARLARNPARLEPDVWHSYGLLQLLAPYYVEPTEHPRVLLDPVINADRGAGAIARLLARAHGDVLAARYLYVGGGIGGSLLAPAQRFLVREALQEALVRFAREVKT